ncbi:phosphate ABC transporter substrate-binding protein [Rhizobiaceae bacterium BDR2-2]|uniref:Phosphate ABC transporter substrate-binding protein n=1 Tax=Ectorhizobium quercum TaxID=2965071 RepID=A0AAE3MY32_9HYPH|nr:phosphate ABC transporter substrate-binding protein [Ectorhizobium quercum]MCX8997084.1 phosphate ABC transporter substrate-binding protein [Ectorhizobium quercum]
MDKPVFARDDRPVSIAVADYAITGPLKRAASADGDDTMRFEAVSPITRAFRPMAREQAYDICEMAIVTYLQARAYGKPVWLLPIVLLARFQHRCIVCNSDRAILRPKDLEDRTVGVRAFSQTTGAWVRGLLANEYGVDLEKIDWMTFEDGHVAEYADPPIARRAPEGRKPGEMLQACELDAAILGNDLPKDERLVTVIADPAGDARRWYERTNVIPINHMVVVSEDLLQRSPGAAAGFFEAIAESKRAGNGIVEDGVDMNPLGVEALRPSLEMIIDYSLQQGLIPRRLTVDELFHHATRDFGR